MTPARKMRPLPVNALLGDKRTRIRIALQELVKEFMDEDYCFSRIEGYRAIREELSCLEAEERGLQLILRGWGETLNLGLLEDSEKRKMSKLCRQMT